MHDSAKRTWLLRNWIAGRQGWKGDLLSLTTLLFLLNFCKFYMHTDLKFLIN